MATRSDRWPDNVGGEVELRGERWSFFTDRGCIFCAVCTDAAPANFRRSAQEDHDVVYRQPSDEAELRACLEAEATCPVEAIGH